MRANLVTGRERGMALMALLAIVVLVMAYLLVSRFNAASAFVAIDRDQNGKVLSQAKQALIGWVARQAATALENNPGRLPCPEAGAFFGTASEGTAAGNCTLPAIGRLPWRTLGLDKPLDAGGEALWYVVSPGWALSNSTAPPLTTYINSNSVGQLTVDGLANNAVALIIAPGRTFNAATACSAIAQVRAIAGAPNLADYLECENAAGATFVTTGASGAFNDQVIRVTAAEVLPEIEAAVAERIAREIVPPLQGVYASNTWGANISAAAPVYPFPAQFADPAATASYQGTSASCSGAPPACQGLLPVNFSTDAATGAPCTPSAGSPCAPTFVAWTGGSVTRTGGLNLTANPTNCTTSTIAVGSSQTSQLQCVLHVWSLLGLTNTIDFQLTATASNVGMAMRRFNSAGVNSNATNMTVVGTPTVVLNNLGAATVTVNGTANVGGGGLGSLVGDLLCGLIFPLTLVFECRSVTITLPLATNVASVFPDHALLSSTDPATGWFMRNEWYRVMYYAVARGQTATLLPAAPTCAGVNCLAVNNLPAANTSAILLLAGQSRNGTVGSTRTLADFLDTAENRNGDRTFEKLPVGSQSNDRVVVVDSN